MEYNVTQTQLCGSYTKYDDGVCYTLLLEELIEPKLHIVIASSVVP